MKKFLLSAAMLALMTSPALAEHIGVSMARFDDNFLTVIRNGMQEYVKTKSGVTLQVEDAGNDVAKQLNQVQNFVAAKVDAIIVNPVDTDATAAISKIAADAKIPLVYINREPVNVDSLPSTQSFVGSDELQSGTLQATEVCRILKEKGKGSGASVLVIMGALSNQAARLRTKDIEDVIATPDCSFMKIVDKQTSNWNRTEAANLMANWLSSGVKFDAVIANNDESAIGAIQGLKAAGVAPKDVVVGGIDATQDGLAAMQAGDLAVTVFQDAASQGQGAIDTALKLAKGETVDKKVWVPFRLVTPANISEFMTKN